jgi:hypothetical protein
VDVCYSLFHAAARAVVEGRMDPAATPDLLEATIRATLERTSRS